MARHYDILSREYDAVRQGPNIYSEYVPVTRRFGAYLAEGCYRWVLQVGATECDWGYTTPAVENERCRTGTLLLSPTTPTTDEHLMVLGGSYDARLS